MIGGFGEIKWAKNVSQFLTKGVESVGYKGQRLAIFGR